MKRVSILVSALVLVTAFAQAGDMAHSGSWGIQTSLGIASSPVLGASSIGAKFYVSHNIALRVELGLTSVSSGGNSSTGYEIGGGFEFHFGAVGNVTPYLGVEGGFGGGSISNAGTLPTQFNFAGVFGGEYFFSSNFSWAGEIGFGFQGLNRPSPQDAVNTIATRSATMIFTWYLN